MENKRFNSKEEINEYIKNNSTSFKEFEKRLDYSILEKNKKKKHNPFSFKKLAYALASFIVVCCTVFGIYKAFNNIYKPTKCPYELGTYVYYSQEGDIEGLDFSDKSYIIITDKELSGPGTFSLENKDWIVYGQFYECEFSTKEIINNQSKYIVDKFLIEFNMKSNNEKDQLILHIEKEGLWNDIYFQLQN